MDCVIICDNISSYMIIWWGMKITIDTSCDAKTFLNLELVRSRMTHEKLANELSRITGKPVSKASIDNKLSRGSFSADFFIQALTVIAKQR